MQRGFVGLEQLNDFLAIRRRDDVSHERFGAQLPDADLRRGGKRMFGRDDEDQFIQIHDHGMQAGFLRLVGEHAEFGAVAQDVVGNVAAQGALDRDLDHGMQAAELGQ